MDQLVTSIAEACDRAIHHVAIEDTSDHGTRAALLDEGLIIEYVEFDFVGAGLQLELCFDRLDGSVEGDQRTKTDFVDRVGAERDSLTLPGKLWQAIFAAVGIGLLRLLVWDAGCCRNQAELEDERSPRS